jgi:hypothetical protein
MTVVQWLGTEFSGHARFGALAARGGGQAPYVELPGKS